MAALSHEIVDKYRGFIIDIYNHIRKGSKISSTDLIYRHKVNKSSFSILKKMGYISDTETKNVYRWLKNVPDKSLTFFFEVSKELIKELRFYQTSMKTKSRKSLQVKSQYSYETKEESTNLDTLLIEERLEVLKSSREVGNNGELIIPEELTTSNVSLEMSKTEARLLLVVLAENENPYFKIFISKLSGTLFEKVF